MTTTYNVTVWRTLRERVPGTVEIDDAGKTPEEIETAIQDAVNDGAWEEQDGAAVLDCTDFFVCNDGVRP